jgi:hypothetical protein
VFKINSYDDEKKSDNLTLAVLLIIIAARPAGELTGVSKKSIFNRGFREIIPMGWSL